MGIVKMLDKLEKILGRESCDGLAPYLGRGEGGNNLSLLAMESRLSSV